MNGDGTVDVSDLSDLSQVFGSDPSAPNWNQSCDVNDDGKINVSDLFILGKNYGMSYPD